MSAEKIINQIKKDSDKEVSKIKKETKQTMDNLIKQAKENGKEEAKKIIEDGKQKSRDKKKVLISHAHQESNREKMNAREEVIDKCFSEAKQKLSNLSEEKYKKIVDSIVKKSLKRISGDLKIYISRKADKKIAEKNDLEIAGKIDSIGGLIISTTDNKISIDNTFEGILKREKDEIRNKIGKMLFSK